MKKDSRYAEARTLIAAGKITLFRQIFKVIPVRVVASDLEIEERRLKHLMVSLGSFKFGELRRLGDLLEVNGTVMHEIFNAQYEADQAR